MPTNGVHPVNPTLMAILIPLLASMAATDPRVGQSVTRLVAQGEVIWRVPVSPRPPNQRLDWNEAKGPKCIPTRAIRRALLSGRNNVDFVLANRARVRAKVSSDCPALDFYAGLYLDPQDNRLCARRDDIHSRMGGSCRIEGFRLLRPRPPE